MAAQRIDATSRKTFLDGFTGQHHGWLVRVETIARDGDREVVIDDLPLERITTNDGAIDIVADERTHHIEAAMDVIVERAYGDAVSSLRFIAPSGETILTFRTVIAPELVDGMV